MATVKAVSPIHLERKVVVQTVLTGLATAALAVLNGLNGSDLLAGLPAWAQSLVIFVAPTAISFLGGYLAKHSLRGDLDELAKEVGLTPATVQNYFPAAPPEVTTVQEDASGEVTIPLERDTQDVE